MGFQPTPSAHSRLDQALSHIFLQTDLSRQSFRPIFEGHDRHRLRLDDSILLHGLLRVWNRFQVPLGKTIRSSYALHRRCDVPKSVRDLRCYY